MKFRPHRQLMIYHQKLEEAPFPLHHHRLRRQELLILAENVQSTSDSAADLVAVIPRLHHLVRSSFLPSRGSSFSRCLSSVHFSSEDATTARTSAKRSPARERLLQAPP
ncbi:hypothetical protein QR680_000010 [Steinernema hermaphroditum]|uniref:Uncharacterized protein n=1 Tax=Steinernema hermaphroditum TaxID=289476 RepID=A0AA39GUW1_9BILA|nr:hypothetical protein QR680_000010 [Steinernema hermaphroditum]